MEPTKAWWKSKTVWLNAATITSLAMALPDVTAVIPVSFTPYIGALNAVINLILRVNTGVPLGRRDQA
jgi:hypothetical protein